jgi:hypothetical protein
MLQSGKLRLKSSVLPASRSPSIPKLRYRLFSRAFFLSILFLASCHRVTPATGLRQRGYLWQRDWTAAVADAVVEADRHMDGLVVLGTEIQWTGGKPDPVPAAISWQTMKASKKPWAIALRIAPYPGPFVGDDLSTLTIVKEASRLIQEAENHAVDLDEFQLDFDCAQKKLAGYLIWVRAVRAVVQPLRFVITTLPSWLDEPDFLELISQSEAYVLQVHSIPTVNEIGRTVLCDSGLARNWVAKASKLGHPFNVALPTYRCVAGYDEQGNLLGVLMDSVQPAWPRGTRVLEFDTDADELANLVNDWRTNCPPNLIGLIWYRIPVSTDRQNWRWPTLCAVMEGRRPSHRLEVCRTGANPVDLSIFNEGEADVPIDCEVSVTWTDRTLVASDALPGWQFRGGSGRALFTSSSRRGLRLPPGAKVDIGWLRYDQPPALSVQLSEKTPATQ